jgi:hypothetical protein
MALKDNAGLVISCVALTISAATAFYSTFSERLDVRAALTDDFPFLAYQHGTLASADFETRLILINSGNRPVAVTEVWLRLFQVDRGRDRKNFAACDPGKLEPRASAMVRAQGEAFVVRPMEVQVVPLHFQDQFIQGASGGDGRARFVSTHGFGTDQGDPDGFMKIFTCLEARIAAPGEEMRTVRWPFGWSEGKSLGKSEGESVAGPAFDSDRIIQVLKETNTFF